MRVGLIAFSVAGVIVVLLAAQLIFGPSDARKGVQIKASFAPVELLYLDKPRTLSYLEELQGGAVSSEQESRAATNNLEAKLELERQVQAGASSQEKTELQRSITPTAASIVMELQSALRRGGEIETIQNLGQYEEIKDLEEGQFVSFKTEELHRPLYMDPYLAVRQDPTLSALFPMPLHGRARRRKVREERKAARLFAKQVGASPHLVFSLWSNPRSKTIHYLLPLNAGSFNKEDSVLKNGGGSLTVLGKVTRILPEPSEKQKARPSYVDFATRETWRLPIKDAPALLVCRSDPSCRNDPPAESGRQAKIRRYRAARRAMEGALVSQTAVGSRGAVIVPIAIYK